LDIVSYNVEIRKNTPPKTLHGTLYRRIGESDGTLDAIIMMKLCG
jgi:hypothetical protein